MSMASLTLAAILLGPSPEGEPSASSLVERLGSPRYAERERAAADLRDLGAAALPALRAARRAGDAEVRARAAALLDRIEAELMVRPTLVALDFRDRPLAEVARALGQRAQVGLVLQPENEDFWKGRTVTLEESEPVPFWAAIDKLCVAAQLRHDPNTHWGGNAGRGPTLNLMWGGPSANPAVDSGPFRVSLISLHHHRDLNFNNNNANGLAPPQRLGRVRRNAPQPAAPQPAAPQPGDTAINDQFYFQLQVVAEPRLLLGQAGQLRLSEGVDDRDQSLLIPAAPEAENRVVHYNGFYYVGAAQSLQLQGYLKRPEAPGKRIKLLRGHVPVAIASRKPDPLVIPLAGASGKTFRTDGATLIFHEVKPDPNGQGPLLEVTVRDHAAPGAGANGQGEVVAFQPMNNPQSQIEILDAQGRILPFYPKHTAGRAGDARLTLALMNNGEAGAPAQLRYYELARASTEAAFEFRDLPMP